MRRSLTAAGLALAAVFVAVAAPGAPAAPERGGARDRARSAQARPAAACRPRIVQLARGQSAPDDLAYSGSQLLVSDVRAGTLGVVRGGRVHTLMGGFAAPEGIVPLSRIQAAPDGDTYLPDSENGSLYLLHHGRVRLIASGMVRPVDALYWHGAIRVADEYASVIWTISGHHRTRLAPLTLADDLAVVDGRLLAISQFGGLWEVAPRPRLISRAFRYLQGLTAAGPDAAVVADETHNTIERVSGLRPCL